MFKIKFNHPRFLLNLLIIIAFIAVSAKDYSLFADEIKLGNRFYENGRLNEDVTWNGSITIKGTILIAPQTTLRIEPGTVITFKGSTADIQSRLVVMGRLQAVGTDKKPILFNSDNTRWGGILFLSSMKKNILEHCRIENSQTSIEARFSSLSTSNSFINNSETGIALFDSIASSNEDRISNCKFGIKSSSSELELRSTKIFASQNGLRLLSSSTVMTGSQLSDIKEIGVNIEQGRLKITSCSISSCNVGMKLNNAEGELNTSRFIENRDVAVHLKNSPLKISRCRITDNNGDGIKVEDNRATIWGNLIYGNKFNIVYTGETPYTMAQNWWGSVEPSNIINKLSDGRKDSRFGIISTAPWLLEPPPLL